MTNHLTFRVIAPALAMYGPNGRVHWRKLRTYKDGVKHQAMWLAKAANIEALPEPIQYRVTVGLINRQTGHPPDSDNLSGHAGLKAMRDGLAEILTNGEDRHWHCTAVTTEPDPANIGYIEFTLEWEDAA